MACPLRFLHGAAASLALLATAAGAPPAPDPLTLTHLSAGEARRVVAAQLARPPFPSVEMFGDACDILAASGGSPGVVAAMRRASHRAEGSLRMPFAADLFEDIRDPGLVRDKALFSSYLSFPRLEQLEPEVAEELSEYPADLSFPALRTLSPASARRLRAASILRFDGLETLPVETATALCAGDPPAGAVFFELSLNGLRDLGPDAAATLAEHARILNLDGLRNLPAETARALVSPPGKRELFAVSLRGLESLSAATARELAAARTAIDLSGLRTLEPDAAAMLARCGADPEAGGGEGILDLSGVRELSPEAARALTSRGGPGFRGTLDLSGLRTLPPDVARELRHHSGLLLLEDLETITPEAAAALLGEETAIGLRGLRTLPPETAAALAGHRGSLFVAATAPLTVSVARALGRHAGPLLTIAELESLDPATAAELARHPGDLQFPHLTTLSAETAAALAMHTGELSLPKVRDLPADVAERLAAGRASSLGLGVRRLSPGAAAALARCRGKLWLYGLLELDSAALAATAELDTSRLTRIASDALHALTQRTDKKHFLVLSALKTLSAEQAAALAGYRGSLDLDGVQSLAPAVARALAAGRPQAGEDPSVGRFSLCGLRPWDPEVIRPLLATRRANLGQRSLSTLTPEQAAALAVASGDLPLELPGIFRLDDPDAVLVARELARTRGPLALPNLETVSPEALAALAQAADIEIPPIDELQIIPEPGASDGAAIPERFRSP